MPQRKVPSMIDSEVSEPLYPMTQDELELAIRTQLIQLRKQRLIPAGLSEGVAKMIVEGLHRSGVRALQISPAFPGPSAHTAFSGGGKPN